MRRRQFPRIKKITTYLKIYPDITELKKHLTGQTLHSQTINNYISLTAKAASPSSDPHASRLCGTNGATFGYSRGRDKDGYTPVSLICLSYKEFPTSAGTIGERG